MRVVVLHPYTKFEVRRPCHSEDMAHDVCQHYVRYYVFFLFYCCCATINMANKDLH